MDSPEVMGNIAVQLVAGAQVAYGRAKVPVTLPSGEVLTHQFWTKRSNVEVSYDDGPYRPLQPGEQPPDYVRGLWRLTEDDGVIVATSQEEIVHHLDSRYPSGRRAFGLAERALARIL